VKVVHISTHDISGGAARAASRIHEGLVALGVESSMLVAVRAGDGPGVTEVTVDRSLAARVRRRVLRYRMTADRARYAHSEPAGFEKFSHHRAELGADLVREFPAADILHLHWIADYLDYGPFFRAAPAGQRFVWTLHDMNPFTGGCHYDADCGRFTMMCGACPQLGSTEERDLSREIWSGKRRALAGLSDDSLHVVADSYWLQRESRNSSLLGRFRSSTVHYGLDTDVFRPRERRSVRKELGLSENSRVLLFVADSVANRRKGFSKLLQALDFVDPIPGLHLVSIGQNAPSMPLSVPHLHIDSVRDDDRLARIYSAADLFVIPSLQEAYGQTALEAMACGTPAVGFDAGGIPEVIRDGETGAIVPTGDFERLGSVIRALLADLPLLERMGRRARQIVEQEHGLTTQAARYRSLYEELMRTGIPV
jgi:glycosyltransferase involved in cell wall biosynthesis